MTLIKSANNKKWNNVNPRGIDTSNTYKSAVPADIFARFERAEAAHKNLMENAPLLIGAVAVGNWAGLGSGESLVLFWALSLGDGIGMKEGLGLGLGPWDFRGYQESDMLTPSRQTH